jgi:iron complex transport system ATP-binding protein
MNAFAASRLTARNVTVRAGSRNLVEGISIDVEPGQILAVIGANRAGNSTLLRALGGEIEPAQGSVRLDGVTLREIGPARLAQRRAVLPQETRLAFSLTVEQVVALGRLPHRALSDRGLDAAAVARALAAVGLASLAGRQYAILSGGERQRVNLARVLAQLDGAGQENVTPRYLLLDEPTAALDLKHQSTLLALLRRQADQGTGVAAVLHDLNQALLADRVLVLRQGRRLALGAPQDVLSMRIIGDAFDVTAQMVILPDGRRHLATG